MYGISLLKTRREVQNIDETVIYFITRREKFITDLGWATVYGIHIYRYIGEALCDKYEIEDYTAKFDSARQLLHALSNNGVKPNQASYVVEDHLL